MTYQYANLPPIASPTRKSISKNVKSTRKRQLTKRTKSVIFICNISITYTEFDVSVELVSSFPNNQRGNMATKRRKLKTDDKADYEPLLRVLKGGLAFEVVGKAEFDFSWLPSLFPPALARHIALRVARRFARLEKATIKGFMRASSFRVRRFFGCASSGRGRPHCRVESDYRRAMVRARRHLGDSFLRHV
jgi:hypothetical protein